jgi:ribosomal protein S18 acetylase RimI-like enzyme
MKTDSAPAAGAVEILDYQPAFRAFFKTLNEAWIEKYFRLEEADKLVLNHPESEILEKGGFVFFSRLNSEIVGTCGLVKNEDNTFELIKMAVHESARGRKIGQQLVGAAITKAREQGASQVVLYSATRLKPAILLYRRLGFQEVPLVDCHYDRCDIKMVFNLSEGSSS